jgi:hypothetical protein
MNEDKLLERLDADEELTDKEKREIYRDYLSEREDNERYSNEGGHL